MKYNIYCISKGRSQNAWIIREQFQDVIFIVPKEEREAYLANGGVDVICPEKKGLCHARNFALDHAFKDGRACFQTDDDLKCVKLTETWAVVSPLEAIDFLLDELLKSKFKLGWFPPTDNAFYANYTNRGFIIASCMLCLPTDLRFDEELKTKEDYDLTLQHLKEFRGVIRTDKYLWSYEHYTNAGGVVEDRTLAVEHESIKTLRKKWGSIIQLNPKRQGEIRLSFKKKKKK